MAWLGSVWLKPSLSFGSLIHNFLQNEPKWGVFLKSGQWKKKKGVGGEGGSSGISKWASIFLKMMEMGFEVDTIMY